MAEQDGDSTSGERTLAEKLNYLFSMVTPENKEREYSVREAAARMRELGTDMSPSHLSELRRGIKTNPTMRVLQGLADFFQVPVTYFFNDGAVADEVAAELELRVAMRDAAVRDVAFRITGLPEQHRAAIYRLLTGVVHEYGDAGAGQAPSEHVEGPVDGGDPDQATERNGD